jgi:hypothetical protein
MNPWRGLLLSAGLLATLSARPIQALTLESSLERVNFLELYTSHGCSSCPPADAWLRGLERHPGLWRQLIPLAFHVEYWDGLGWADRFASPAFSQRQRDYQRQGGISSVYTPGFVLNGREWRRWFQRGDLELSNQERVGRLTLWGEPGQEVRLRFAPLPYLTGIELEAHLALLGFGLSSPIGGGENRGRTLEESFVVLTHHRAGPQAGEWRFDWPKPDTAEAKRLAIVAWLSRPGEAQPVQAVADWLP